MSSKFYSTVTSGTTPEQYQYGFAVASTTRVTSIESQQQGSVGCWKKNTIGLAFATALFLYYFISGENAKRWVGKCVRYYEGRAGWVLAQNTLLQEAQCQCDRKSWSCLVKNPGQTAQKSPKSGTGIVLKGSLPAGSSCLVDMNNNNNNNPIRNIPSHFKNFALLFYIKK